jgi:hypothetical protein
MFSVAEKQRLAKIVEDAILELNHPEMPKEKPVFELQVLGKEDWSFARIHPNWRQPNGPPNVWNEMARDVLP